MIIGDICIKTEDGFRQMSQEDQGSSGIYVFTGENYIPFGTAEVWRAVIKTPVIDVPLRF